MSFEESGEREVSTRGVKEAIASGLVLGGFLYFLSDIHPAAGLHALITMRIASVLFLLAVALAMRVPLKPAEGAWPLILFGGAIDMTANALFLLAVFAGNLAIAAVLTALYPASTVFLARIVLKERLQLVQKIGVGLALIGVALIAAK
jgi:drug/metabolite transporter (DMT)-like permease